MAEGVGKEEPTRFLAVSLLADSLDAPPFETVLLDNIIS
jgi:hypothetical protein